MEYFLNFGTTVSHILAPFRWLRACFILRGEALVLHIAKTAWGEEASWTGKAAVIDILNRSESQNGELEQLEHTRPTDKPQQL